jgi:hypothetical protein
MVNVSDNIKEWDRGETVRVTNTYTDSDSVATDPDSISLKIYKPDGTLDTTVAYAGDIVKSATGIYYYDYDIASDADVGWWNNVWTAVFGTADDVVRGQFYVRDPQEKMYCSVVQAYNRCGMESDVATDSEVMDYIRNSMDWIDSYFGKSFAYSTAHTQWFDTDQPNPNTVIDTVFLRYRPVRSVTSVEEYDTSNDLTDTYTSDDYWLDEATGKITLNTEEFEHQKHRIKIVYNYGFDQIPRKITELCAILSGQSILLKFAGASYDDVTSWSAAGLSIGVGEPYMNATRTFELLNKQKDKLIADVGRLRESIFIV